MFRGQNAHNTEIVDSKEGF